MTALFNTGRFKAQMHRSLHRAKRNQRRFWKKQWKPATEWPSHAALQRWTSPDGYECIAMTNPMQTINGYVRIPHGHPACDPDVQVSHCVHGGITFRLSSKRGVWLGFDTLHAGDFMPSTLPRLFPDTEGRRWTLTDVIKETERLSNALKAVERLCG